MKYGLLLDLNVLVRRLENIDKISPFFDFLESNPFIATTTRRSVQTLKNFVKKERRGIEYRRAMEELKRLPSYLAIRDFSFSQIKDYLPRVKELYESFLKEGGLSFRVSPRFRRVMISLYPGREKLFYWSPESEDRVLLAIALYMKEEENRNPMFLASYDEHFIGEGISKRIEREFGVVCAIPEDLFPRLKS